MVDLNHGFPFSGCHDNGTGFDRVIFTRISRRDTNISRDSASDVIVNVKEEKREFAV